MLRMCSHQKFTNSPQTAVTGSLRAAFLNSPYDHLKRKKENFEVPVI